MRKHEVKVGGHYIAKVAGQLTTVRLDCIRTVFTLHKDANRYDVTNLRTGRTTTFDSAAKFRCETKPEYIKCRGCNKTNYAANKPWTCLDCAKAAQLEREAINHINEIEVANLAADPHYYDHQKSEVQDNTEATVPFVQSAEVGSQSADHIEEYAHSAGHESSGCASPTSVSEGEQSSDPTSQTTTNATAPDVVSTTDETSTESPAQSADSSTPTVGSLASKIAAARATASTHIKLTQEQQDALEAARWVEAQRGTGQRVLVLKAGAGTGKTFELQQMEKELRGILQYTAYNKALVVDSTPKFKIANCATTHALASKGTGYRYHPRLKQGRMRSSEVASRLGIADFLVELPESIAPPELMPDGSYKKQVKWLKARWLAGQVMAAVARFTQSADREVTKRHFTFIPGIDEPKCYDNNDRVKDYLLPFAQKMWRDIEDPNGTMPFSHDCYVKLWQLNNPVIPADVIMLDEYQDTAPVMVDVLKQQKHALLILVGDDNQRIYEWRGAINAGDEFPDAPQRLLSKSFRFGQTVADVANAILSGLEEPTDLVMKGFEAIPTRICAVKNPRCYLFRTNAGCISKLMQGMEEGKRGHLIGSTKEVIAFCKAAIDLQAGSSTDHPELGCFSNWAEVQEYSKEDEGADLRLMVKLIDEFTAQRIIRSLENMPKEAEADFVVCTAHRSKGREWPSVQLGQDFRLPNKLDDAERRLVYVAATRGQEEVDLTVCPTFCGGYEHQSGVEPKFIPGIKVTYTIEMPTQEALDEYRARRTAAKAAPAPTPTAPAAPPGPIAGPARLDAAQANVGPANAVPAGNTLPAATFSKLKDGSWGLRVTSQVKPGDKVTVTTRAGARSTETVGVIVWSGNGVWLCSKGNGR